jgi:hypothetical protein
VGGKGWGVRGGEGHPAPTETNSEVPARGYSRSAGFCRVAGVETLPGGRGTRTGGRGTEIAEWRKSRPRPRPTPPPANVYVPREA